MQKWNRRDVLASLGMVGGAALITGCGGQISGDQSVPAGGVADESARTATRSPPAAPQPSGGAPDQPSAVPQNWTYQPLDPAVVGQTAYEMYPQGSCMYAVFGSVVSLLADKVGEPFRSFPLEMMRFGAMGIAGTGSTCGVVIGCAALIGLFYSEQKDKRRDELISDLCLWYESTMLPQFQPAKPAGVVEVAAAKPESILCHLSVGRWCKAAGCDAFSGERRERCRRLSCDGAMKTVELLNGELSGTRDFFELSPETHACIECHGRENLRDSMTTMNCISCHQFDSAHP